jgi:hypothetical protein
MDVCRINSTVAFVIKINRIKYLQQNYWRRETYIKIIEEKDLQFFPNKILIYSTITNTSTSPVLRHGIII